MKCRLPLIWQTAIRKCHLLCAALLLTVALGGCSRSRGAAEAQLHATFANSSAYELCGQRDDGLVHVPPAVDSFAPPPQGGSYRDPQYGCRIVRLTDSRAQVNLAIHHQYSTINAVNQNDTRVMLITEWGQGLVTDISGRIVVGTREFPAINSANVPWARDNPDVFYYTNGNGLYKGSIAGNRVRSTLLYRFSGDDRATIPDEEDLSEDGDHLWVVAGPQTFLYTISTNTLGPAVRVGEKDKACGWHKIQITPSNKMLVTWSCNGPGAGHGQEIYGDDGILHWHMFDNSLHTDTGTDLKGNEIAVVARIPDTYKDACPSGGGVDIIRLDPPHTISCLVDVNWVATHISYRDSSHGWVVISFFDDAQCPHYSCFSGSRLAPDWQASWRHFYEEIVVAKVDGSGVYRLAHHRSRSAESYWAASRAAISKDGRYVVFDSNMGISDSGLNNYSDVYLIDLLPSVPKRH